MWKCCEKYSSLCLSLGDSLEGGKQYHICNLASVDSWPMTSMNHISSTLNIAGFSSRHYSFQQHPKHACDIASLFRSTFELSHPRRFPLDHHLLCHPPPKHPSHAFVPASFTVNIALGLDSELKATNLSWRQQFCSWGPLAGLHLCFWCSYTIAEAE
jgi:hypothetical protein